MMSASERIENAEASCESINEHIDSIGEFYKIVLPALNIGSSIKKFNMYFFLSNHIFLEIWKNFFKFVICNLFLTPVADHFENMKDLEDETIRMQTEAASYRARMNQE